VQRLDEVDEVANRCPQNFNGFSECFAAIQIYSLGVGEVNYTIRADGVSQYILFLLFVLKPLPAAGLYRINVVNHNSDFEERVLPLQWAVDAVRLPLKQALQVHLADQPRRQSSHYRPGKRLQRLWSGPILRKQMRNRILQSELVRGAVLKAVLIY